MASRRLHSVVQISRYSVALSGWLSGISPSAKPHDLYAGCILLSQAWFKHILGNTRIIVAGVVHDTGSVRRGFTVQYLWRRTVLSGRSARHRSSSRSLDYP